MLCQDHIEELIGWKNVIVGDVKNVFGTQHIYGRMKKRIHICPKCREKTECFHDYQEQIKSLKM